MTLRHAAIPIALVLVRAALQKALGAGGRGGGGGGGMMPSESAPRYDPAAEYQKGVTASQASDFQTAAGAFKPVVDAVPKHAPAQYLLGSSLLR